MPNPDFMVKPLFDAEYLRNGTRYKQYLMKHTKGSYTRPTHGCHFDDLE